MNTTKWRAGIQSINDEAAGMVDVSIVDAVTWAELLAHALMGDRGSEAVLQAVIQAGARVKQAPRRQPTLCLCCPRAVKRVSANTVFGVAMPAISNPTGAIGFFFATVVLPTATPCLQKQSRDYVGFGLNYDRLRLRIP